MKGQDGATRKSGFILGNTAKTADGRLLLALTLH